MSSPNVFAPRRRTWIAVTATLVAAATLRAGATSEWLQHAIAGTPVEAALYRAMSLPGVEILFPRPPKESVAELDKLVSAKPTAALYSLRARQEEQALEFDRAEADWKSFVAASKDHTLATVELADFYQRRHDVKAEFASRLAIGNASPAANDAVTEPASQQSWISFERAMQLAQEQTFDDATVRSAWRQWIARYPQQPSVVERAFTWELDQAHGAEAQTLVEQYRKAFPQDSVFPVKAQALLALRSGGTGAPQKALEVYDAALQPLWPDDLLKSYFALLADTHRTRSFLSDATARLQAKPDDFEAEARIFLYYREQSKPQQALAALAAYRAGKEQRHAAWSAEELFTFAQLAASVQNYPEASRYDFALAGTTSKLADGRSAHEAGLAGMIDALLTAPDSGNALGAANLSMYRDIATLDQGPGYWNGVLSLWLNSTSPANELADEDAKAQPYFHRAKAAELLAQLDHDAPQSPDRAPLHAKLLSAYLAYGDDRSVVREGASFLDAFPHAADRVSVAFTTADAYARLGNTTSELAIYDRLLTELAPQAGRMPLTTAALQPRDGATQPVHPGRIAEDDSDTTSSDTEGADAAKSKVEQSVAFELNVAQPALPPNPAAVEYSRVLERYLSRLTQLQQLPQALAVLRRELDRNPDDPAIYDRLASFLEGNNLSAQTEELYRSAIARFSGGDWYSKMARFYLRHQRSADYATLTRNVTRIFSGTELDGWFREVSGGGPKLALQLNLYAHQRFPHDLVFTQNLLNAYRSQPTRDETAWQALLRQTWWESPGLTQQFFEYLSSTGKLDAELAQLGTAPSNPAAMRELAEGETWQSHFEQSAPLYVDLAANYPADEDLGTRAADLQRSLAWLDPAGPQQRIASAVAIEQRLLAANPVDTARLARIGDMLADHADGTPQSLAASAEYWRRMPSVAPGQQSLYLDAATVFWDYFQFDDAMHEIQFAREHFADPALFAYEAGAIDEGKEEYAKAIDEYVAASLDVHDDADSYSPARTRLLQLARRPAMAKLADAATQKALDAHADVASLRLRVAVLEEQKRTPEIAPLMQQAVARATTEEELSDIAVYAGSHSQPAVREVALDKQSRVAHDPVERLQLRYELASAYEASGDAAAAGRVIDGVYRENPKLLGVVRATVDFDWRTHRQQQAVSVLLEAARIAQPALAEQFTAEASQKANLAGNTQQARSLAEELLAREPYNPRNIALVADTYTSDPAGLAQFYRARLDVVRTAPMAPDDRKQRTALLRRGLIPALTISHDNAGAVDQYIALVSAYPEDEGLVNEAALYAIRYDRKQQWISFLTTTTHASTHDSRFFLDLAISQVVFDDSSAAIDAYAHAIAIRKDHADWYMAKASLEETLGRFDDEVADDLRLYELTYHDPQWMVAVARTRVRQGRKPDAIAALETAYLRGAQTTAHDEFLVATQLEQWNMLPEAKHYAELGEQRAGIELLHPNGLGIDSDDAIVYARLLTRMRQPEVALATLRKAVADSTPSPASMQAMIAAVKANGAAGVEDAAWRARFVQTRHDEADANFQRALQEICKTADTYDTPEERATFAGLLQQASASASDGELRSHWIPAMQAAHLAELEAQARARLLLREDKQSFAQLQPLVTLQRSRMLFAPLAQLLEQFAAGARPEQRDTALAQAIHAHLSEGGDDAALRLLHEHPSVIDSQPGVQSIFLKLLLQHSPQELAGVAASKNGALADAAVNTAIASAPLPLAVRTIAARGRSFDPVWTQQYVSLAGLYGRDTSTSTGAAFRAALAWDQTIGQRLSVKPVPAQQLTGDGWFYTAARYGQWLTLPAFRAEAEDAMPADLEHAATVDNYRALATSYVEAGRPELALTALAHAKELAPTDPELEDASALVLWSMNRKPDAVAAWQRALGLLRAVEDRGGAVPESFWSDFALLVRHVHARNLTAQLRPAIEDVLRIYLARNGSYRSNELLQAMYAASSTPQEGTVELLAVAASSKQEFDVLDDLNRATWLPAASRQRIIEHQLSLLRSASDSTASTNGVNYQYRRAELQFQLAQLDLANGRYEDARAILQAVTGEPGNQQRWQTVRILIAANLHTLPALITDYESTPENAPSTATLEDAASRLSSQKDWASARTLLEFVFARGQRSHELASKEYLLLAEARLQSGDLNSSVALLNSMTRRYGSGSAELDNASELLERTDHAAEALPFLTRLAASEPWNAGFSVRLAEAQGHAKSGDPATALAAAASASSAPYTLRVRAAHDLRGLAHASSLHSGELDLLASDYISPGSSEQPYMTFARAQAAEQSSDAATKVRLLRSAIAIAPDGPESEAMRRQLFKAEHARHDMRAARTALDGWIDSRSRPGVRATWMQPLAAHSNADDEEDATANTRSTSGENPDDAALFEAEAAVYLATDDRSQAIAALQSEREALGDVPAAKAVQQRIDTLLARNRLDAANAARRPVVHVALDQSNIVRAKLDRASEDDSSGAAQQQEEQP